ncbi:hypothetical protein [Luteimonas vadosa]|uniref:Uncharacterized protein n=1 Tax=Luteimonas vadosa TaxID=1165507 RepID=A0ABP9E402_9GAMM
MTHLSIRACRAWLILLVATFALSPLLAAAQENNVSSAWVLWPKAGHTEQFEKAIREHAEWRKKAGEGFTWNIYQPTVGDDLGHYTIFSGGHAWADFDKNQKWSMDSKASAAFNRDVAPHVERVSHYFYENEDDISYWNVDRQFPMYAVTRMKLGPGQYGNFRAAVSKAREAATAQKYGGNWLLRSVTGGQDDMTLVIPHDSYASMSGPSPTFIEVMAKHMGGQDKAVKNMTAIQSAIEGGDTTIYVFRPDLSTPAD